MFILHHRRTVDLQSTFFAFYLSVQRALKNLDTKKAAGPDKLDPFSLKLAADFIAEPLSHIFNLSHISYQFLKVWKSAFVLPLLKGREPSKVFEKIVSNRLKEFIECNDILSKYQSGFRKQHSTVTAALKVLNDIRDAADCKRFCVALFIEVSNAFIAVDHRLLLDIPHHIGVLKQTASISQNALCSYGRFHLFFPGGLKGCFPLRFGRTYSLLHLLQ